MLLPEVFVGVATTGNLLEKNLQQFVPVGRAEISS